MQDILYNYPAEILILAFLAVTFIQSGFDKIFDWKGNLEWLNSHFAKTVFKGFVPVLLLLVTLTECAAGLLCTVGIVTLVASDSASLGLFGAELAALNLVLLLLGQRIAKDYSGAASLVPYFLVAVAGVYLLIGA